jgi:phospholipid transport system substrate-binding protein
MGRRLWAVVLVFVLASGAARAEGAGDPAGFVGAMVKDAVAALGDPALGEAGREQRLGALLGRDFDIPRIARYVLGRYWTGASADERATFARLFEQWVVNVYGGRLSRASQENVTITGTRSQAATDAVVTSEIVHPSGPPTHIVWRVSGQAGNYRIIDIDVEGVSMALTEREEIAATIERGGGTVAALNRSLAAKLSGAGVQADR